MTGLGWCCCATPLLACLWVFVILATVTGLSLYYTGALDTLYTEAAGLWDTLHTEAAVLCCQFANFFRATIECRATEQGYNNTTPISVLD